MGGAHACKLSRNIVVRARVAERWGAWGEAGPARKEKGASASDVDGGKAGPAESSTLGLCPGSKPSRNPCCALALRPPCGYLVPWATGFTWDYVFDWTILKYQQQGTRPSSSRPAERQEEARQEAEQALRRCGSGRWRGELG